MEDDPQIKIHRNSTYGYQKRSKDDTRPLSTFSNVHRSSSIDFHIILLLEDDPYMKILVRLIFYGTWDMTQIWTLS